MYRRAFAMALLSIATAGCAEDRPRPERRPQIEYSIPGNEQVFHQLGYSLDASPHWADMEPNSYQLSIHAANDGSGTRPIRDHGKLRELWDAAAARKCASKTVEITMEPEYFDFAPGFCTPFPGETDCAPSIVGNFLCR